MSTVTTAELREGLDDPQRTVVDIRPLASYNGWRRNGEARGGHIPGAVAFPAAWLRTVDEVEVRRLLAEKGITADRDVVVYGDDAERCGRVRRGPGRPRHRGRARLRGRGHGLGRGSDPAARPPAQVRGARPHPVAARRARWEAARGAAEREVRALPRQFRCPRGICRGSHPGRRLPRHELARGPGRLEPALPGGHRGRPPLARRHGRHHGRRLRSRHGG